MTLKSTSFSTAAAVAPSENQSMQPRKRGRKPKPVVEFPQAVISEWTDVPCFHEAFALHLERHADSIGHLHKALSYFGAKIERSTFVQWAAGKKAPTSVKSIAILAMIERRYRLPAGYFKAKLTNNSRAASGHTRLSGVTRSERRRLAWHLPDDFDDRPARERQEILQWVRSVIISGTTDYRRYQAEAAKHRFAIRFPSLTHRRRLRNFDPANEGEIQSADEADLELAVARTDAPPPLEAEMADLVRFKTATLTDIGFHRNGVWNEATAFQKIEHLGLLFGALAASPRSVVKGYGVPTERLAMGLLVFPAILDWYVQWRERRRGFYTVWEANMFQLALAFCRVETGWLRQSPHLASRLQPIAGLVSSADIEEVRSDWDGACDRLYKHGLSRVKEIERVARVHRDPFEPIMPVLEADSPVGEYRKITDEILKLMPNALRHPRAAAEASRSFLMVRLGLHLGVRQKNLRQLLICPKGRLPTAERHLEMRKRGELRWNVKEHGWEVLIPASAFKNASSSFFGNKPFRLVLPNLGGLYEHIEAYIDRYRRVLPITADPAGEWFTFEKGASKTSGGEGWADVWRKACFAWEYKGPKKDLKKAFDQLLQYSVALENPPLLIVSDMNRIRIHTNWTNTVQEVHDFELDDLIDGDVRERLKRAFTDPEHFKPSKTRQALTEETAKEFAGLAQRLRDRGHDAGQVAHFVNQLVFCMFAEDVGLLPDNLFTKMLDLCRSDPASFAEHAGMLFGAMAKQGGKVGFTRIDWFNGGLFADDYALPVTRDDVEDLYKAAQRDWSQIDPSILGTLFERGLDPAKRSQLGAHYTDRDKIMMIVHPVIIEPLEAEWAASLAKMAALIDGAPKRTKERLLTPAEKRRADKLMSEAAALHQAFIERLVNFRVLDPACGSGNFLYVALRALKDIEHRANLDAEALGLSRGFPRVGPECVLGIELNPYAAELARVSVWIGEIQWMRRNGFDAAKNPILRNLDTIECRDAVLNDDGTRAEWPVADAIIGNPPFLGSKYLRKGRPATKSKPALEGLGDAYVDALFAAYKGEVPASADLVSYWFSKTCAAIKGVRLHSFGMIATKSVGKGASNRPLAAIQEKTDFHIFHAWRNEPWVVDGADVRVAIVCAGLDPTSFLLDGVNVSKINADLTTGIDLSKALPLHSNRGKAFQGVKLNGPFEIAHPEARSMLRAPLNPNNLPNDRVVKRFCGNDDVTMRDADCWVIDFTDYPHLDDASLFERPFAIVRERVTAHRSQLAVGKATEADRLSSYWLMQRPRTKLRAAVGDLRRVIAVPETSEHLLFRFLPANSVFSGSLFVIAIDDMTTFGILSSTFHSVWAKSQGNQLGVGNQGRYNATRTFQTFPFPEGLTPDIATANCATDPHAIAIAAAAARLNELRENWLNPADLVVRESEVVAGCPDRILPKDEVAARELAKRTLTNLYNARPAWLDNAHRTLDAAVADAYGWSDDWRAGMLSDEEILSRLFVLNQARASGQG